MTEQAPQLEPGAAAQKATQLIGQEFVLSVETPLDCAAHCPLAGGGKCEDGPQPLVEVTAVYSFPGVERPALGIGLAGFVCGREVQPSGVQPPEGTPLQ